MGIVSTEIAITAWVAWQLQTSLVMRAAASSCQPPSASTTMHHAQYSCSVHTVQISWIVLPSTGEMHELKIWDKNLGQKSGTGV